MVTSGKRNTDAVALQEHMFTKVTNYSIQLSQGGGPGDVRRGGDRLGHSEGKLDPKFTSGGGSEKLRYFDDVVEQSEYLPGYLAYHI